MVTFKQLVERAQAQLDDNRELVDQDLLERIVRSTVEGMGFHFDEKTGAVCDPAPRPRDEWEIGREMNERSRYRRRSR